MIVERANAAREPWSPSRRWQQRPDRLAKRCLDIVVAAACLLVLLPVLLLLAALVRVTSPGPIIFRQTRVGKDGRPFQMYKFRTMAANSDAEIHRAYTERLLRGNAVSVGGAFKLVNDPRVTAVGRILRRCSLDELPQLLNVLKGEMSLVGPRPPLAYEVELYDAWARRRLSVTPGMTGLWQVSGRSTLDFHQMVDLDLSYITNWSFMLDLRIVLRTPAALITARGAI